MDTNALRKRIAKLIRFNEREQKATLKKMASKKTANHRELFIDGMATAIVVSLVELRLLFDLRATLDTTEANNTSAFQSIESLLKEKLLILQYWVNQAQQFFVPLTPELLLGSLSNKRLKRILTIGDLKFIESLAGSPSIFMNYSSVTEMILGQAYIPEGGGTGEQGIRDSV